MKAAIQAMQNDESLWNRYFDDFTQYKLHLLPDMTLFTKQILGIDTFDCNNALSNLVLLHVRFHVYKHDTAKVVRVLKPISKLEIESSSLTTDPTLTLSFKSVVSPEYTAGQKQLPNISSVALTVLFATFCEAASTRSADKLTQWHKSYLSIVCLV